MYSSDCSGFIVDPKGGKVVLASAAYPLITGAALLISLINIFISSRVIVICFQVRAVSDLVLFK